MMKNRLLLRADGNSEIGLGHIFRLIALSRILKDIFEVVFIINKPSKKIKDSIFSYCKEIIEIKNENDFFDIILPTDVIVLDGYNFDTEYQSICKKKCFKLVSIDDVPNFHFVSDIIINHAEGVSADSYSKEKYSKTFFGCNYAILRESFISQAIKEKAIKKINNIFINFGGSDLENNTKVFLDKIINKEIKFINIVLGAENIHVDEINLFLEKNQNKVKIHKNLDEKDLVNVMLDSDLAITTPSTISYELACIGIPLILYKTAENQNNILNFMTKENLAFEVDSNLKNFDLIFAKFQNLDIAKNMLINQKKFFNGSSLYNIKKVFLELIRK